VTTSGRSRLGCRFPDAIELRGGLDWAIEAKVGYVGAGRALKQIAKDVALRESRAVDGAEWHFFVSDRSGRVGPSAGVLEALQQAGIPYYIHLP